MNNTEEIWVPIPGYEGRYYVNKKGQVKSTPFDTGRRERILKPQKNGVGYLFVTLCLGGKLKMMTVHKIVAMAYLGHTPDGTNRICVDHINDDKVDNRLENLQLLSNRDNIYKTNSKKPRSSSHIGVSYNKRAKKWVAMINYKGKAHYLGLYTDEEDASRAYQNAHNNFNQLKKR